MTSALKQSLSLLLKLGRQNENLFLGEVRELGGEGLGPDATLRDKAVQAMPRLWLFALPSRRPLPVGGRMSPRLYPSVPQQSSALRMGLWQITESPTNRLPST